MVGVVTILVVDMWVGLGEGCSVDVGGEMGGEGVIAVVQGEVSMTTERTGAAAAEDLLISYMLVT